MQNTVLFKQINAQSRFLIKKYDLEHFNGMGKKKKAIDITDSFSQFNNTLLHFKNYNLFHDYFMVFIAIQ